MSQIPIRRPDEDIKPIFALKNFINGMILSSIPLFMLLGSSRVRVIYEKNIPTRQEKISIVPLNLFSH